MSPSLNLATTSFEHPSFLTVSRVRRGMIRAILRSLGCSEMRRRSRVVRVSTTSISRVRRFFTSLHPPLLIAFYLGDYILENPEWKFDVIPEIMNGKNIADFIDPDIEEKLEALEREEERLEAEGFYDSEEEMFDSDDEREAAEMVERNQHKVIAQGGKKATKNAAKLPRTAGLRTLSELTGELTKAGYDPSRIQERAEMLAKIQGAKRKRQREEEEMDMDEDEDSDDYEDEDMDVDGEVKAAKKQKTISGRVVTKRIPATDRQTAGLKDERVCFHSFTPWVHDSLHSCRSNTRKPSKCVISPNGHGTCWRKLVNPIVPSRSKWYVYLLRI
jgi:hypothetical protein